jgi:LPXTG-motif cell wall-anchored protein
MVTKSISAGTPITITYNATLNSNASIDPDTGNPNRAKLVYSNDPNVDNTGIVDDDPQTPNYPDEPKPPIGGDPGDVVGETPWDKVNTYTTAIKIKKVDQDGKVLEGAAFTLTGSSSGQAVVIKNTFTANESGTYWKLKDGTFTTTDPTGSGVDANLYDSTTTKYAISTSTVLKGTGQSETNIVSEVGTDGYIVFQGLGAGSYTLTETTVPTGYNSIAPINFTIAAAPDATSANWDTPTGFTADGDMFLKTIENRKGAILPTTGGIGTKLFYIFGSILVAGSVIFLVTKKRMSAKEN